MFLFVVLLIIWIAISGYISLLPLLPGIIALLLGVVLYKRAKHVSDHGNFFSLRLIKFIPYILYLIKEIYLSNIFVAKKILRNKYKPGVFTLINSCRTKTGMVIFANSVTLTPGTIILRADKNQFIIHAIDEKTKESILDMSMKQKVKKLEKKKEK